jgi:hypothetical protein
MLEVTFFCSSVLITPLAFCSWFSRCLLFVFCLFGKWTAALTWIWSFDTLEEGGEQGDARR